MVFLKKHWKNTVNLTMKAVKYLFALWAGVLVYASLSAIFGAMGLSAYRQLENEQRNQEANIEELKLINRELENTMNSLLYDRDTLAIIAREKGFATQQERFIRIVGLGVNQRIRNFSGEVVSAVPPQYINDKIMRIIACCTAFTIFICMAAFDAMRFLRER